MKFEFEGKKYLIEFRREFRSHIKRDKRGIDHILPSKYPSTTATIVEVVSVDDKGRPKETKVYRVATAGCYHEDAFTLEKGRCRALRMLTNNAAIPKAMKPILWKAYHERPRPKSEPKKVVEVVADERVPFD